MPPEAENVIACGYLVMLIALASIGIPQTMSLYHYRTHPDGLQPYRVLWVVIMGAFSFLGLNRTIIWSDLAWFDQSYLGPIAVRWPWEVLTSIGAAAASLYAAALYWHTRLYGKEGAGVSNAKLINLAIYCIIAMVVALVVSLGEQITKGVVPGFMDGDMFAGARNSIGQALGLFGLGAGFWLAANRPRFGSESLAVQTNDLKKEGIHRDDMVVLPTDPTAVSKLPEVPPALVEALADELWRRRAKEQSEHRQTRVNGGT